MQQKDVLYIDVEDDITAIIGKVKAAKHKIVALVPPKRTDVLQSSVNLRLLARAAGNVDKKLVIISSNAALGALAASAKIPVAKTLQSRPELVEISALNIDDEDVIDGGDLPVGDHAGMAAADEEPEEDANTDIPVHSMSDLNIDGEPTPVKRPSKTDGPKKRKVKVPDFGTFRKRLVLGGMAGVLLIVFIFWAAVIAPHATIVVSARTSDVAVRTPVTLAEDFKADSEAKTLPSITKSQKKESTVEFTPTGKKEVGEKATGSVVIQNAQSGSAITIQAGTYISSSEGKSYIIQSTIVVPGCTFNFPSCDPGVSAPVNVVAEEIGDDYNVAGGTNFAVAGQSSQVSAVSNDGLSGGTKKTVTVVSAEDVEKASQELAKQDTDGIKEALIKELGDEVQVIDSSYKVDTGDLKPVPGIDEEISDSAKKAKLTVVINYTIVGVSKAALSEFLNDTIAQQLTDKEKQRIFETGSKTAELNDYEAGKGKKPAVIQLSATGKVGPKIDDAKIKELAKGKKSGEVQEQLKTINGVSGVEVKLSPFWVIGVPGDTEKISVEFKLLGKDE